jgi:cell division protein FtsW (lipid II flippase)
MKQILTSARLTQHNEEMINAWRRTRLWKILSWVILTFVVLGLIGHFIWHYETWPFSLVLIVLTVLNGVGNTRGLSTRHPQENDPNRR